MIKIAEPNAKEEYETLLQEVIEEAEGTGDRVDLMESKIDDAVQARRYWADVVNANARRIGFAHEIKAHLKRTRVVVVIEEREVSKPRMIGTKRLNEAGRYVDLQLPIEALTFDQIRDKRKEYLSQVQAYTDNVAVADRYLALAEMAPGCKTPAAAARKLGISLDDYLAKAS